MSNNKHRQLSSVYISCPMSVDTDKLMKFVDTSRSLGVSTSFWQRGTTYNEERFKQIIKQSDAFILVLPTIRWKMSIDDISAGSKKELKLAITAGKPIFIAYHASSGFNFYNACLDDHMEVISGISGTSKNFAWATKGEIDWNHPTGIEPKSWLGKQMEEMGMNYRQQMEQYIGRRTRGVGLIPVIDHVTQFTRRQVIFPGKQTDKRILLSKRS